MGVAYFIVLERKIDGLDTMMDGKSLSRSSELLDTVAAQLRVRPLSEFISIDPEQAADFLEGEGADVGGIELPPLLQFSAQDGLTTVQALLAYVQAHLHTLPSAEHLILDLSNCERILNVAAKNGVGWHFEVDF